jgi:hypothetical protein
LKKNTASYEPAYYDEIKSVKTKDYTYPAQEFSRKDAFLSENTTAKKYESSN